VPDRGAFAVPAPLLREEGWTAVGTTTVLTGPGQGCEASEGHFLRFTETFAAYLPITKKITLAAELRLA